MIFYKRVFSLVALMGFVGCSANAAPETVNGIHVRYIGSSPHAVKAQEVLNKAMTEMCSKQGMTYRINGPVSKIGDSVTDEYFAPGKYYSASYKEYYVAVQNSLCESTVTRLTKTLIYHSNPPPRGGGMLYEHRTGGKSPGWTKHELPSLGIAGMVIASFESSAVKGGASAVAAGKGVYGGYPCSVSQVRMPGDGVLSDSCEMPMYQDAEKKVPLAYPVRLKLASSQYQPETGDLVSKTVAESVNLKASLPATLFFPPEDAFRKKAGDTSKRNATSKWCEKQEQKTGINPCKNPADGSND